MVIMTLPVCTCSPIYILIAQVLVSRHGTSLDGVHDLPTTVQEVILKTRLARWDLSRRKLSAK